MGLLFFIYLSMAIIKFETGPGAPDAFNLYENDVKIGEMIVEIVDGVMTVYHTEVDEDQEGKGHAKQLLMAMVSYVRENRMKVIPLCPYVHAQFSRDAAQFSDIWKQE